MARTQGALPRERDIYKLAAPMGRFWRRKLLLHFKVDSNTLWEVLWTAFQVRHPRSAVYRAAVRQQLRVMNSTRAALAEWARARWYQHGAGASDRGLHNALSEIGWEVTDVTWHLRPREGAEVLHIPWERWARQAPGQETAVYTDAGARQGPAGEQGSGVGLVVRIGDRWWGAAVPLPPWIDNTTGELLGISLGRLVVDRLREMEAATVEQAFDAQAAAVLADSPPERQRHPLRRALQQSVAEVEATQWWVKSHQEAGGLVTDSAVRIMGNVLADAQATEAVARSARGDRLAVPLQVPPTYGVRPTPGGTERLEWPIHEPDRWRPPRSIHPRMKQLLQEEPEVGVTLVPLHLGMWHPLLKACPRCEHHEEVATRYRCPCQRSRWKRALAQVEPPWRLHGGATLRVLSGVPRSKTCIAAAGEGTHDWAAVPHDHVFVPPAVQGVEFRKWARIVRAFMEGD